MRPPIAAKPQSPIVKMRTNSAISAATVSGIPTPYLDDNTTLGGQQPSRAASEPPADAPAVAASLGELFSLPPQTNSDSPMPELLSLKDRLSLFEKVKLL
jgi:hypothetical protein